MLCTGGVSLRIHWKLHSRELTHISKYMLESVHKVIYRRKRNSN
jgi:hypothetical protein